HNASVINRLISSARDRDMPATTAASIRRNNGNGRDNVTCLERSASGCTSDIHQFTPDLLHVAMSWPPYRVAYTRAPDTGGSNGSPLFNNPLRERARKRRRKPHFRKPQRYCLNRISGPVLAHCQR